MNYRFPDLRLISTQSPLLGSALRRTLNAMRQAACERAAAGFDWEDKA